MWLGVISAHSAGLEVYSNKKRKKYRKKKGEAQAIGQEQEGTRGEGE
jgi:hypothetical protein